MIELQTQRRQAPIRLQRTGGRRGATLILVLNTSLLVSVIGMSGLLVARANARRAMQSNDWAEAGVLAMAGLEHGLATINSNSYWRLFYASGYEVSSKSLGNGTFTWKVVDDALGGSDYALWNDSSQPARLYGIGRVGTTVRVYSVRLTGATPIDALRTVLAADDDIDVNAPLTAISGPISANDSANINADAVANVEADYITGAGDVLGFSTLPISSQSFPSQSVFDDYKKAATELTVPSNGKLTASLLSPTVNPFGAQKNSEGLYLVRPTQTLKIEISRIQGTLIVECPDSIRVELTQAISWEPAKADYPILLIRHVTLSAVIDKIQPAAGNVVVGGVTYPSKMAGLIQVQCPTGAWSSNLEVRVGGGAEIVGTVLVDGDIKIDQAARLVWDPNLYEKPPIGYSTGQQMRPVVDSYQWNAAP
ncbi:MAG: hypothetical protein AB7O62_12620 [Pirellulales bacterium]